MYLTRLYETSTAITHVVFSDYSAISFVRPIIVVRNNVT